MDAAFSSLHTCFGIKNANSLTVPPQHCVNYKNRIRACSRIDKLLELCLGKIL
jgi:hypothetical protein